MARIDGFRIGTMRSALATRSILLPEADVFGLYLPKISSGVTRGGAYVARAHGRILDSAPADLTYPQRQKVSLQHSRQNVELIFHPAGPDDLMLKESVGFRIATSVFESAGIDRAAPSNCSPEARSRTGRPCFRFGSLLRWCPR
jgi:hypothetical protein